MKSSAGEPPAHAREKRSEFGPREDVVDAPAHEFFGGKAGEARELAIDERDGAFGIGRKHTQRQVGEHEPQPLLRRHPPHVGLFAFADVAREGDDSLDRAIAAVDGEEREVVRDARLGELFEFGGDFEHGVGHFDDFARIRPAERIADAHAVEESVREDVELAHAKGGAWQPHDLLEGAVHAQGVALPHRARAMRSANYRR